MRKPSDKCKLRDILKTAGLAFSKLSMSWRKRLRNCSRTEDATEIGQLNAACNLILEQTNKETLLGHLGKRELRLTVYRIIALSQH